MAGSKTCLRLSVFYVNVLFGLDTLCGKQSQNLKVVQIEIGLVNRTQFR